VPARPSLEQLKKQAKLLAQAPELGEWRPLPTRRGSIQL
jgi:hypothetical protein